jgi:hypothetical protein
MNVLRVSTVPGTATIAHERRWQESAIASRHDVKMIPPTTITMISSSLKSSHAWGSRAAVEIQDHRKGSEHTKTGTAKATECERRLESDARTCPEFESIRES